MTETQFTKLQELITLSDMEIKDKLDMLLAVENNKLDAEELNRRKAKRREIGKLGGKAKAKNLKKKVAIQSSKRKEAVVKAINTKEKNKEENLEVEKFLQWFNKTKEELTGKPSRFVTLTGTDKTNLKNLKKLYKNDSKVFLHAFKAMLNNEWVKEKGMANPTHFLRNENFQRYANTDSKLIKNNESRDDKLLAYVKRNLKK
mgnify:CR=1 FL=1